MKIKIRNSFSESFENGINEMVAANKTDPIILEAIKNKEFATLPVSEYSENFKSEEMIDIEFDFLSEIYIPPEQAELVNSRTFEEAYEQELPQVFIKNTGGASDGSKNRTLSDLDRDLQKELAKINSMKKSIGKVSSETTGTIFISLNLMK